MRNGYVSMPEVPDANWLARLRRGNVVRLMKENTSAFVEWPYEPPGPRSTCGRIGLRFSDGTMATWFIRPSGQGINGTQCLWPVVGHVPDEEPPAAPDDIRYLMRRLDRLEEAMFGRTVTVPVVVVEADVETDVSGMVPALGFRWKA